ncbi:YihY/virulence factor BrkB family protein [Bacteroidota bacterium]
MLKKILHFITTGIWMIDVKDYPPVLGFFLRQARIVLLASKEFRANQIQLRASALTYYSLLSIVPIAAMAFGIAKGFGFQARLEREIRALALEQEDLAEVVEYILKFASSMLENINGGVIAGVGVVLLLWAVMKVLGNIENSFNVIWQIRKGRPFARKFADYLSMMMVAPILFFLSTTITGFVSNIATNNDSVVFQYLGPILIFLVRLIPYLLICLLFTILFVVMPNTKVRFKYGFSAGLIAAIIFQVIQYVYFYFQGEAGRLGAIYGSFVAFPLFLIWMQLSWLIVLLGAEISFAYQNIERYEFEAESLHITPYNRRLITFLVMYTIIKNFEKGEPPRTSSGISQELGIPVRLVREIIFDLLDGHLLVEATTDSPKENAYVPGLDIGKITVAYLVEQLDLRGDERLMAEDSPKLSAFADIQKGILDALRKSPSNKLLKDI